MRDAVERRTNQALRQRIDALLQRVEASRAEIVERGLTAVHDRPGRHRATDGDVTPTATCGCHASA